MLIVTEEKKKMAFGMGKEGNAIYSNSFGVIKYNSKAVFI